MGDGQQEPHVTVTAQEYIVALIDQRDYLRVKLASLQAKLEKADAKACEQDLEAGTEDETNTETETSA